ncbi:hypothetical protein MRX96_006982 [Rhipicephalus microplus]
MAHLIQFALRDRRLEELQRMEPEGVITLVRTAQWATPVIPVLKRDGGVRVCGHFKTTLNPLTVVESIATSRIEILFALLTGGKKFTKLDLQDAYKLVPLDEKSKS